MSRGEAIAEHVESRSLDASASEQLRENGVTELDHGFWPTHDEYLSFERHVLQDNIVLCDAKSGILLGASAAIVIWCVAQVESVHTTFEAVLFAIASVCVAVTMGFSWVVMKPRIFQSEGYIFWASQLFQEPASVFTSRIQSAPPAELAADMIRHLHILAEICRKKFANLRRATIAAELAFLFIFLAVCAPKFLSLVAVLMGR